MSDVQSTVEYRDIQGFPGYRVGNDGSVWSCWGRKSRGLHKGHQSILTLRWRLMKPQRNGTGYWVVYLQPRTTRLIHRLVLESFVGPCPNGHQACHNDGDRRNNHLSNLRWDTPRNNERDKVRHGTALTSDKAPFTKLTPLCVCAMRSRYAAGDSQRVLACAYHVAVSTVSRIINRKTWKHI
jgi:hypothetical protein